MDCQFEDPQLLKTAQEGAQLGGKVRDAAPGLHRQGAQDCGPCKSLMVEFGDGGQALDVKLLEAAEAGEAIRQYFL